MNLEELGLTIDKNKNIIETLPVNTIVNLTKKREYLDSQLAKVTKMHDEIRQEMQKRYSKLDEIKENPEIAILKSEEDKLTLFREWNEYNTAYEKMHLDYYLYQLHRYYKEDLKSVNACLYSLLETFKNVGVELVAEDFNYHPFAREYISTIINHKDDDKHIHEIFETLYWKCSNILGILEMNFKSLYYKYIKKIERYYSERKEQILKNHKENEIYNAYYNTMTKRKHLESIDIYTILQKVINREILLSDFSLESIEKKKKRFFNEEPTNMSNILEKLHSSLEEYEWYNKYGFIINDMKNRLKNKEQYKGLLDLKIKEIEKKEKELFDFNLKYEKNKKPKLFGKIKKDDKLVFQIQENLTSLEALYSELDDIKYNDLILEKLSMDSPINEALKMASSNYLYFVKLKKEQDGNIIIKNVTSEYQTFMNSINSFSFTILNNIYILDEKNIAEIISDRYKLLNVSLENSDLDAENLINIKKEVEDLLFADNLSKTALTREDIEFYLEMKKHKVFE